MSSEKKPSSRIITSVVEITRSASMHASNFASWPVAGARSVKRTICIAIALVLILIATYASFHTEDVNRWSNNASALLRNKGSLPWVTGGGVPEDALKLPGWRDNITWHTSDPDVQLQHWLQRLSDKENGTEVDWARNKTILLLGDSVVRDWIWRLCDNHVGHEYRKLVSLSAEVKNEKTQGWECVVPQTQTRLINGFIYGMTNYSRYDTSFISKEWPPGPWGFEDRIPDFVEQYSKYNPDMIVFNSGAWDFKFMFRRDLAENNKADIIEPDELREYGERLRQCMRMLREAFTGKKIVFLQMHPFSGHDVDARWFWSKGMKGGHDYGIDFSAKTPNATIVEDKLPHLFTRRRVSQLASTYRRVAAEEAFDDLDYWKIAGATDEGMFIRPGDAIHPADPSIAVMLDWLLEKFWRWEVYKV